MMHISPNTRWQSSIVPVLKFYSVLLSIFFMALPAVQAEQKQVFGPYEVHYIAINSTEITTEVAKQYQLTRSRQLALLNISVLETGNNQDLPTPVNATLNGRMENLIGQRQALSFQRAQEGQAVYYLAQFEFDDEDTYRFIIDVKPETSERSYTVKFSQKLYREN